MDQLRRIEKGMTELVLEQVFFASLALRLNVSEKDVGTFATDGKNLYIDRGWCAGLDDKEIVTVLCHEVLHLAMGHLWRAPKLANHRIWNIAIDNEANWTLEEANEDYRNRGKSTPFPWPKQSPGIREDRFRDMAAEKVYEILMKEFQENKQKFQSKYGDVDGDGSMSMGELLELAAGENMDKVKEEWEKATIQAAHIAKKRGFVPGSIEAMLDKLTNPKLSWKQMLRDYLLTLAEDDWSFRKPNTRYSGDFILPSLYSERIGPIVFVIDSSGSTSPYWNTFVSEAQFALDELSPEYLDLIYVDYDIQDVARYYPGDQVKAKIYGGGGTSFKPVFEHLKKQDEEPCVLVYLTDLYGDFPDEEPCYPVLWLNTEDSKAPFGETIKIDIND